MTRSDTTGESTSNDLSHDVVARTFTPACDLKKQQEDSLSNRAMGKIRDMKCDRPGEAGPITTGVLWGKANAAKGVSSLALAFAPMAGHAAEAEGNMAAVVAPKRKKPAGRQIRKAKLNKKQAKKVQRRRARVNKRYAKH